MKNNSIADSHSTTCEAPALTAVPKKSGTITSKIWARTRSRRPSSRRSPELWACISDSTVWKGELWVVVTDAFVNFKIPHSFGFAQGKLRRTKRDKGRHLRVSSSLFL